MTKSSIKDSWLYYLCVQLLITVALVAVLVVGANVLNSYSGLPRLPTSYPEADRIIERADIVIDNLRAELDKERRIYVPKPMITKPDSLGGKLEKIRWQIEFIDDLARLRNGQRPTGKYPGMPNPIGDIIGSPAPNQK